MLGGRPPSSLGRPFTLAIIGSGIAATRLSHGVQGFTLVANAIATGLVLAAIILAIGSVSGGQLNRAVTIRFVSGLWTDSVRGMTAICEANRPWSQMASVLLTRERAGATGYQQMNRRSLLAPPTHD